MRELFMKWKNLTRLEELQSLQQESLQTPVIIFKHSTRCSISRTVLSRIERQWNDAEMETVRVYYLDLLSFREISNQIAAHFNVEHESPQILVIRNGKVIFHRSHLGIDYDSIKAAIKN